MRRKRGSGQQRHGQGRSCCATIGLRPEVLASAAGARGRRESPNTPKTTKGLSPLIVPLLLLSTDPAFRLTRENDGDYISNSTSRGHRSERERASYGQGDCPPLHSRIPLQSTSPSTCRPRRSCRISFLPLSAPLSCPLSRFLIPTHTCTSSTTC